MKIKILYRKNNITLSNDFIPNWKRKNSWYMGDIIFSGLEILSLTQSQKLFRKVKEKYGEYIYGDNAEILFTKINDLMNLICSFIKNNSPIPLKNVTFTKHLSIGKFFLLEEYLSSLGGCDIIH